MGWSTKKAKAPEKKFFGELFDKYENFCKPKFLVFSRNIPQNAIF